MNIFCAGLNHRTANIDVREHFAVRDGEMEMVLEQLRQIDGVSGAVMLSTCPTTLAHSSTIGAPLLPGEYSAVTLM